MDNLNSIKNTLKNLISRSNNAPEVQSILRNTLKKLNDFIFESEFKKDFSSSDSDSDSDSNFIVKSHEPTRDPESIKEGLQKSLGIKNINKLTVGAFINIKPKKKA